MLQGLFKSELLELKPFNSYERDNGQSSPSIIKLHIKLDGIVRSEERLLIKIIHDSMLCGKLS